MRHGFFRYLIATVLIALGVILVLENIGVAEFNMRNAWLYIYPVLFIVFGLKWMIEKIRYKGGSWIFGSFFFIFGSLLLLDRFGIVTFAFRDAVKLWPLLIIYFGFMFIRHSSNRYVDAWGASKTVEDHVKETVKDHVKATKFSIGNHEFNQPNWKVEPTHISTLAGDFYFDFTKAFIPDKKIPITVNSLAGDIHILIPENVEFRVYASVKAGDVDIDGQKAEGINRSLTYETLQYETAVRKIDFTLKLKAGSVRVDRV